MNRTKIIDAILNLQEVIKEDVLRESLKHLNDTNLIALAIDLGINTDFILSKSQRT